LCLLLIEYVAAGLVAFREKFGSKIGIKEFLVIKRAVNVSMAFNAREFGSPAIVFSTMGRGNRVTLHTKALCRLIEQTVIR